MPFIANTPESLVARSDSKNPSTTCRGITASGRPCRRPISTPVTAVPARHNLLPSPRKSQVAQDDPRDETLYCWQHKEQASLSARSSPGPRANATPILEERTSIDTLADRLGLVEVEQKEKSKRKPQKNPHDVRRSEGSRPSGSVEKHGRTRPPGPGPAPPMMSRPKPKKKLSCCFCFDVPLDEVQETPAPRPQPKPVQHRGGNYAYVPRPSKAHLAPSANPRPTRGSSAQSPTKSYRTSSSRSQTGQYLSFMAPDNNPATTSALLTELARPYVDSEEPGYIYMFWMTPPSEKPAPVDAARSLLAPPPNANRARRPSHVVSSFAQSTSASSKKTMLLKIGRATNVQRRMQQWSRQCGYEVEVLRYYPYLPGASGASGELPRMTSHCHRVERLVHLELAGRGLKAIRASCEACGRDHREWFEVNATREGVGVVDEVIRRWVEWDEAQV